MSDQTLRNINDIFVIVSNFIIHNTTCINIIYITGTIYKYIVYVLRQNSHSL